MLLDVNVLLALAWPNHQFHAAARRWFQRREGDGWATCAITELGFIRLSSNPAFTEHAFTPLEAAHLLAEITSRSTHRYLEKLPQPSGLEQIWQGTLGYKQTTDNYLVALARHNRTRLVTFDRKLGANAKTRKSLELLSP